MNILCCYLGIFSGAAGAKCAISPLLSYRVHMQCSFDFILVNEIINLVTKRNHMLIAVYIKIIIMA